MELNKEEETQKHRCRNCDHELKSHVLFCPNCGQRNTDGRITFRELMSQFLASLFELDGRVFQTMGALVIPGKLTESFFEGKHIRYYHPVRLFVLSGALFIALLSVMATKFDVDRVGNEWKNNEKAFVLNEAAKDLDTLCQQLEIEINDPIVPIAFDSLKIRFANNYKFGDLDSVELTDVINFGSGSKESGKKIALEDMLNMPEDSIAEGKEIPDNSLVVGAPGRVVRQLEQKDADQLKHLAQHYVDNSARYRAGFEAQDT